MAVVQHPEVVEVSLRALRSAGVSPALAERQVDLLVEAELRDLPSHGLLRLPRVVQRILNGVADPAATGAHDWRAPGFLSVDGQRGLGPVVAITALDAAMERARTQGTVTVSIRNANHVGMLAYYADHCARRGRTLLGFTISEALVHPWGGRRAMVGTNPMAIGIPVDGADPFVMDVATGKVSMGKIHDHANRDAPIPGDWALDSEGTPTTDAARAKDGAISPVGDAKGYALGLAFELLVASLAGAALGRDVKGTLDDTEVSNKSDLFIVIDQPVAGISAYLDAIRRMVPAEGFDQVRIPGDRSRAAREARLKDGLPVDDRVWQSIVALADRPADAPAGVQV